MVQSTPLRLTVPLWTRAANRLRAGTTLLALAAVSLVDAEEPQAPYPERETGVPSYSIFEPGITGTERGVNSVRIDQLGRLLVSTGTDLVTYDGNVWVRYRQEHVQEGNMPIVLDTALGPDGILYAGTDYGMFTVEFLPSNRFRLIPIDKRERPSGSGYQFFNTLKVVGSTLYGQGVADLARFDLEKGSFELLTRDRDYGISHFQVDDKGDLYLFNTVGGLWRREGSGWKEIRRPGDPYTMRVVRSSVKQADGRLLFGTDDHGLLELRDGDLEPVQTEIDVIGTPPVIDMESMGEEYLAVSLLGLGVALVDGDGNFAQIMSRSLDHRFAETTHLRYVGNGVLWGALENSLVCINFLDPLSEYAGYASMALPFPSFERHRGRLHIIADFNLLAAEYYAGGALKGFKERPLPKGEHLKSILSTQDGLMCGTEKSLFILRGDDSIVEIAKHDENVLLAEIGKDRDFVVCASIKEYFLLRRTSEGWQRWGEAIPSPGLAHEFVRAGNGSLWIEHGLGLVARLRLVDGRLEARIFDESDGIGNSWINIWELEGSIYLSKEAGVFIYWNPETEMFERENGLLSKMANYFSGPTKGALDLNGNLWVPSTAGHGILWKGEDGSYEPDFESLASINDEFIYKMMVGDDGEIWMRGRNFVARYDPSRRKPPPVLEAPNIYSIELLGRRQIVYDARTPDPAVPIVVEHADNSLRCHFTYPMLGHRKGVRFECFVQGLSKDWIDLEDKEEFVLSNIRAGSYALRVRSTIDGEHFSPVASLAFKVKAPLFRSGWAWASYTVIIASLLYALVRFMQGLERRKTLRLQVLVEQRTHELDEANRALRAMYDKAEAGNRAKSAFIAMISHEMRTPLNAIIGPSSALLDEIEGGGRHQRILTLIHRSAKHLLSLINDILTFSGKEPRASALAVAPFDLHLLVDELLDAFAIKAKSKGLELNRQISEEVPVLWEGDVTRIRQVIINLLDNAIKCTDSGAVEVRVDREQGANDRNFLRVEVRDTGIGVVDGEVDTIFDPFVQGHKALTRPHEGTGLGLAICKQLVEQMNGELGYRPSLPQGSTFWFTLPLSVFVGENPSEPSEVSGREGFEFSALNVLVAEDNSANRFVMEIELERLGCSFKFAADGEAALERLNACRFDLVFLDLKMPGMDGLRVARAIRGMSGSLQDIPLIALSAYLSDEVRRDCQAAGFDDYIDKPVTIDDLARSIKKVLGRRSTSSRNRP